MTLKQKIAQKRAEMQERTEKGTFKKKHDPFLLWGEYPHGWQMIKDSILCLMLMSALIGQVKQIDIASLMTSKTITIINETRIQPVEASTATLEPKAPQNAKISEIVAKVHRLESSEGKNDGCKAKGKVNGYGYAQNDFTWNCYESQDEVRGLVEKWFEKNLKDKTEPEALCYYNTGIVTEDCEYYKNYQLL